DFEDIEIKRNAPQILESQLRSRKRKGMIGTGAMCDPYMHIENELQITRQCLSLIEKYGFGLSVLTKSDRVLRDMDILKAINAKAKCIVQITLTTSDDELCRKIEPDVSATSERVHVLNEMRDAGIPTIVWLCPILPFINDTEENLRRLLDSCVSAGVRGILCFSFGVTMREGNREYFYSKLDEHFPGMKERYIQQFGDAYECRSPDSKRLMSIFRKECGRHGIMHRTDEIFAYLTEFSERTRQTSLF
ncbi:MAG: radical SAM protein, partial [Methanomassiliicoccaceae archaeon]|nr:radical SAM protein [Methanomassiliicoccaceae archaeon]